MIASCRGKGKKEEKKATDVRGRDTRSDCHIGNFESDHTPKYSRNILLYAKYLVKLLKSGLQFAALRLTWQWHSTKRHRDQGPYRFRQIFMPLKRYFGVHSVATVRIKGPLPASASCTLGYVRSVARAAILDAPSQPTPDGYRCQRSSLCVLPFSIALDRRFDWPRLIGSQDGRWLAAT